MNPRLIKAAQYIVQFRNEQGEELFRKTTGLKSLNQFIEEYETYERDFCVPRMPGRPVGAKTKQPNKQLKSGARLHVRLSEEEHTLLNELAEESGMTKTDLILRYLKRRKAQKKVEKNND